MFEGVLVLVVLVALVYLLYKRPSGYPPGPLGLPLLGYYPFINRKRNYITSWELSKKYGPVVGLYLGNYRAVFVNGWEAVKEALSNEDCNGRPNVCLLSDRFDGQQLGIVFTDEEFWRSQRRFTLQHFRNLGFGKRSHAEVVMEEVEELLKDVAQKKGSFSIKTPIGLSVINIMWALLGGERLRRNDPRLAQLVQYIKMAMHPVSVTGNVAIALPFLRYMFPGWTGYRIIKTSCKGILEFIKKTIADHKTEEQTKEEPRDFIGIYLRELQENKTVDSSFSEKQLEASCLDLLCAVLDTTSAAMTFAIMYLCMYPEKQEKMQKDIDSVIGQNRLPNVDDRTSLPYVEACLCEVNRMRAPAPILLPHRSIRDTVLMGHKIPKNSGIMINVRSVLMDPEYWGDPEVYRPERFLTPERKFRKDERMIAFGKGKRSCLGESLAKMTSFLMIASLVQRYKIELSHNESPPDPEGVLGLTLNSPEFKVVLTPRF